MLKLDGRTVRGRLWKELQSSGEPLKQGILQSKKICTHCNQTPADFETEVIECMTCRSYFHSTCLIQPVSEDFLQMLSRNPSVWWHCLGCISCSKSSDHVAMVSVADNCHNGTSPSDVVIKSTLMTFKKEILTLVSETMEKNFQTYAKTTSIKSSDNKKDPCIDSTQSSQLPTGATNTWANVVGANSINTDESKRSSDASKEIANQSAPEKHVLLLEPLHADVMSTDDGKKESICSINKAMAGVNVEFCKVRKSGIVAIGFKDSDAKTAAEEKIKRDINCSASFLPRNPKQLVPKVTVMGINDVLFDKCDKNNKDEMKDILIKDIIDRNSYIKTLIDSTESNFLNVVMIQKVMPYPNVVSYTAALKMSSPVRRAIYENGDRLYISLNRCKVTDRFYVKQCYHCQKHGHITDDCPDLKQNKPSTCLYCSGEHRSKNCPDKNNLCCSNCIKSSNPAIVNGARAHSASSLKCPVLQAHVKNIQGKTENWKAKNLI